jgi:triacylglycerol lipase
MKNKHKFVSLGLSLFLCLTLFLAASRTVSATNPTVTFGNETNIAELNYHEVLSPISLLDYSQPVFFEGKEVYAYPNVIAWSDTGVVTASAENGDVEVASTSNVPPTYIMVPEYLDPNRIPRKVYGYWAGAAVTTGTVFNLDLGGNNWDDIKDLPITVTTDFTYEISFSGDGMSAAQVGFGLFGSSNSYPGLSVEYLLAGGPSEAYSLFSSDGPYADIPGRESFEGNPLTGNAHVTWTLYLSDIVQSTSNGYQGRLLYFISAMTETAPLSTPTVLNAEILINNINLVFPSNLNEPPTAVIKGPTSPVPVNNVVQLDGTGSHDPEDDSNISYKWSLQGPTGSKSTLQNLNTAEPTFIPDKAGTYTIFLTVKDSQGLESQTAVYTIAATQLAISLQYQRDISRYASSADPKTVYGTDLVIYTITITNNGPDVATAVQVNDKLPMSLKYVDSTVQYDSSSGILSVGNLLVGESKQLKIYATAVNSGEIVNTATVTDSGGDYDKQSISFIVKNPVILVHGFMGSTADWSNMIIRLKREGIPNYAYDYAPALNDFAVYANRFDGWLSSFIRGTKGYNGKIDIVCHSMGALVTRYWMAQRNHANANQVGQWIGIGPVISGAAVTDIWNQRDLRTEFTREHRAYMVLLALVNTVVPLGSNSAVNMQTTDPEILALNSGGPYGNGIETGVKYNIIVGTHASEISVGRIQVPTVERIGNTYSLTNIGDGVVANVQQTLPGIQNIAIEGVSHTKLPGNPIVIDNVAQILKNT